MESHLHWADYLILSVFLAISLSIGVYHSLTGGRQKTTAEFIMANRKLRVIPTAISLFVSLHSAMLFLGVTAEMYSFGIQYLVYLIATAPLAMFLIERLIVPWLYPLKLVSVYDYLEMRYMSKSIRIFGASAGILKSILVMGGAMYAPSAALESATGLSLSVSVPVMAAVTVAYTALGGMRAVIWTDVFQFATMLVGLVAIFVKGLYAVGGISNVFRLVGDEGRLIWANFSFDPRVRNTVWSIVTGMGFNWISGFGFSQASVQRFSAVDSLSKSRATILVLIPPIVIMDTAIGLIGLIVFAYYSSIKCDPLVNKEIANPNLLLPYFVVTIFADSPGFSGLFLSTLYGATLSTVSSLLSGSAANFWEDILKWKYDHLPEEKKALINKILVVLFGVLSTGMAFLAASIPGPITQVMMVVMSSVAGPLVAIFVLGGISRHTNWKGALLGGIVGSLATVWLTIGSLTVPHKHPPLPPVSVEHCPTGNTSSTVLHFSMNQTNYTTNFEMVDGNGDFINSWNQTTVVPRDAGRQLIELQGIENFYAISYLWFTTFGALITGFVAAITSLVTRDKDLEAKVDKRLLMRFRFWGWSDEKENEEHPEDDNKTKSSSQETKGQKRHEAEFLEDIEMTDPSTTQNRFHKNGTAAT